MRISIKTYLAVTFAFFLSFNLVYGQEDHKDSKEHQEGHEHQSKKGKKHLQSYNLRHLLAFTVSATHVPKARQIERPDSRVFVPAVGLDYFYILNHKWEIGAVCDFEFGKYFVVTDHRNSNERVTSDGEVEEGLRREYVGIFTAAAAYNILHHWPIIAGMGVEVDRHHTLFVMRLGTEYHFNVGNNWTIAPAFMFDFKEGYDVWSLTISVGKAFGKSF